MSLYARRSTQLACNLLNNLPQVPEISLHFFLPCVYIQENVTVPTCSSVVAPKIWIRRQRQRGHRSLQALSWSSNFSSDWHKPLSPWWWQSSAGTILVSLLDCPLTRSPCSLLYSTSTQVCMVYSRCSINICSVHRYIL